MKVESVKNHCAIRRDSGTRHFGIRILSGSDAEPAAPKVSSESSAAFRGTRPGRSGIAPDRRSRNCRKNLLNIGTQPAESQPSRNVSELKPECAADGPPDHVDVSPVITKRADQGQHGAGNHLAAGEADIFVVDLI